MKTSCVLARHLVVAALMGAIVMTGCSGEVSFTTAKLTEATLCLGVDGDSKPLNPTDEFSVNTAAVTAEGTVYMWFSYPRPDGGWPIGEYQLNLYIDGKEAVSLPFTVSATATGPGGGSISQATMALGVDAGAQPLDSTSVFQSDTPVIFCSVAVSAPAGTEVLSEWYYVSGEWQGVTNRLIGSVPYTVQGPQYVALYLTAPDEGWWVGQYQVKLYLNGALQEAVPFTVESAPIRAVTALSIDQNNNPINPTSTFPVGVEKIYAVIYVNYAPAGTKLVAEWYDIGSEVHRFINKNTEMQIQTSEKPTWVSLGGGTGGWKAGQYAIVLLVNGERQLIVPFTVQ